MKKSFGADQVESIKMNNFSKSNFLSYRKKINEASFGRHASADTLAIRAHRALVPGL
jgi:hypothetical protein